MITDTAAKQHKIRWFRYTYDGEGRRLIVRRGRNISSPWGYEATCSCGWETRSGGAIEAWIQKEIRWHKESA